jgi:hypothetical protein
MRQTRKKSSSKMKSVKNTQVTIERIAISMPTQMQMQMVPMEDESLQWDQGDYDDGDHSQGNDLHQSLPAFAMNGDTRLRRPGPPKVMKRRSSDPAINAQQSSSPPSSSQRRKRQTSGPPVNSQSGSVGDRLYGRSVSSSSMYSSGSSKGGRNRGKQQSHSPLLEDGLHQVRWADTNTDTNTDQQGSRSRHTTGVATSSTASSSVSEMSAAPLFPDTNNRQAPSSLNLPNNNKSSRARSISPFRVKGDSSSDGFGKVVKSPKPAQKVIKAVQANSRRRNRHVEAELRISQSDAFVPSDDLFGDFANPSTPNSHDRRPSLGSMRDIADTMKVIRPSSRSSPQQPRLWASMSHVTPGYDHEEEDQNDTGTAVTTSNATFQGKEGTSKTLKAKKGVSLKGIVKKGSNHSNANDNDANYNYTDHHNSSISSSSKYNKKTSTSLSVPPPPSAGLGAASSDYIKTISKIMGNKVTSKNTRQIELAPTNIVAMTSPTINAGNKNTDIQVTTSKTTPKQSIKKKAQRRNSDPIKLGAALESSTTHSPTITVTTTGMTTVATTRTSSSAPVTSLHLETISKDDLFLIAMEKFAARVASKAARAEHKAEKSKLKKEKIASKKVQMKRRRRSSLGGDVEFNVDDQSEFMEGDALEQDDEEDWLSPETVKAHYVEIDWNPPEFVKEEALALAMSGQGRSLARRASAPASWNDGPYEPITPSFVYKKGTRKSSRIGVSVLPAFIVPPFCEDDNDLMEETATAVNTILNQGSSSVNDNFEDGFGGRPERKLSVSESMRLLHDLQSSKSRLLSQSPVELAFPTAGIKPRFAARSVMLSTESSSEPRMAQTQKSSRAKAKRRGSTSVLEMSTARSTPVPEEPRRSMAVRPGEKERPSRSRSRSPTPRQSTRSREKTAARHNAKRRVSIPETSCSPPNHAKLASSKKSSSRRRAASATPERRKRSNSPQSRPMARSDKVSSSHGVSASAKKGRRKSEYAAPPSSSRGSSTALPTTSQADQAKELDRSKSRSTPRRPTKLGSNSLSQSVPVITFEQVKLKTKEKRSKSTGPKTASGRRKSADGGTTEITNKSKPSQEGKKSKSSKPGKRRASLGSIEAERPSHQPSEQSSWSGLTLSSSQPPGEPVYSRSRKLSNDQNEVASDEELDILR